MRLRCSRAGTPIILNVGYAMSGSERWGAQICENDANPPVLVMLQHIKKGGHPSFLRTLMALLLYVDLIKLIKMTIPLHFKTLI